MRAWITRTEPGASRLAAALRQLGIGVFVAPVLRIERRQAEPPQESFDFALFVSEHAVVHAASNGWRWAPWRGCPAAAIGTAADAALREHGVAPCLPPQANAASVLQALRPLPPRAIVVKGEGGREVLQQELRQRGGSVAEWNVYRRVAADVNIAGEEVDAVVVGSGDGAGIVAKVWFADGRSPTVPLLAPSERVARLAARSGFANVVVTLGANPKAVAAALAGLRRTCSGEHRLG